MNSAPSIAAGLLASAQQGSLSSLGRLMGLYGSYLKLVVASQLDDRLRQRVSVSDVVQETFFEAHRDFETFRGACPQEFLAWLRQILVHNLLRAVEQHVTAAKRDVRREVSLDRLQLGVEQSTYRLASLAPKSAETPGAAFERREHEAVLAEALAELPDEYQQVLRLRHLEGLPFAEVAQKMDRTAGAVRMLWLRSIRRLREEFAARGID